MKFHLERRRILRHIHCVSTTAHHTAARSLVSGWQDEAQVQGNLMAERVSTSTPLLRIGNACYHDRPVRCNFPGQNGAPWLQDCTE